jgi:hypothetical protein
MLLASGILLVVTGVAMLVFKKQRWIAILYLVAGMGLLVIFPLLVMMSSM